MAAFAGICSSGVRFRGKESGSLAQYHGLRPVESKKMASAMVRPSGSISSPARKCRTIRAVASPTVSAPKREKDPKKRIVITGMGLVSVFGSDIDTFYDKLLQGVSGISLIDRYCLVAAGEPLTMPALEPKVLETMDRSRIGVLVGSGMGGLTAFSNGVEALIQKGYKKITPFFIPYSITNMGSALLAIDTGLMGPNYSISTACATANYCFYAAANHIRRACRALSQRNEDPQKASRPWDKDRDGFVMGEGSGVLACILFSFDFGTSNLLSSVHCQKDYGELGACNEKRSQYNCRVFGGAITCDAHHMTDPRSDGLGVSSCIAKSLEDAGVSPEEVNYVNAHATSTLAGDLAEVNAIKKVFKDTSEIKMNGTKARELNPIPMLA
ncbi:3-oxoacyl-[acyl-carrier-protein] synthase I, chloroplastic [Vitis vinifera]|uniref:beta-ketoacyl-[acyl-carrier-protein] synthase I n=1 Tax=Vitis vinifera TaxID=29760 RepID=A0A438J577_VITVI|nr:3-oxoacyl-[acyl-carrier-protein] synthase I, chloroplastic [Vitis vinifera]